MPRKIDASLLCCSVSNATDNSLWAEVRLAETANTNGRASHLGNVGQREGVMKSELKFLQAARAGKRILPPKRNIYREEKAVDEVFILFDGWAFSYKLLPDGRRQILDFLLPGSFIGLHLLWFKAMPHSVQTLTDVSLCVFDKEKFGDLLRRMPEYEWQLLRYSASCQANADERLSDLGRRTARERIARLVLELHDHLASCDMVDGETIRRRLIRL